MDTFYIIPHPILASLLVVAMIGGALAVVAHCRPSRGIAAVLIVAIIGYCLALRAIREAGNQASRSEWIDRKNFVCLPVDSILLDVQGSMRSGNWSAAESKVSILYQNWSRICMSTTNDPWAVHDAILAVGTEEKTAP